jgi:hypothetical protein
VYTWNGITINTFDFTLSIPAVSKLRAVTTRTGVVYLDVQYYEHCCTAMSVQYYEHHNCTSVGDDVLWVGTEAETVWPYLALVQPGNLQRASVPLFRTTTDSPLHLTFFPARVAILSRAPAELLSTEAVT